MIAKTTSRRQVTLSVHVLDATDVGPSDRLQLNQKENHREENHRA